MNSSTVYEQEVIVTLEHGLHLVPCSKIAEIAKRYSCVAVIEKNGRKVDAKTIFDLMSLGAVQGTRLKLQTQGDGAQELLERLVALFESNFQT